MKKGKELLGGIAIVVVVFVILSVIAGAILPWLMLPFVVLVLVWSAEAMGKGRK